MPSAHKIQASPQSAEREKAIEIARRALKMTFPVGSVAGDVQLLARQFLRALGLSEQG